MVWNASHRMSRVRSAATTATDRCTASTLEAECVLRKRTGLPQAEPTGAPWSEDVHGGALKAEDILGGSVMPSRESPTIPPPWLRKRSCIGRRSSHATV